MKEKLILIVVAGLFLVFAAAVGGGRYETTAALQGAVVRTDKITGEIVACDLQELQNLAIDENCKSVRSWFA